MRGCKRMNSPQKSLVVLFPHFIVEQKRTVQSQRKLLSQLTLQGPFPCSLYTHTCHLLRLPFPSNFANRGCQKSQSTDEILN